MSRTPSSIWRIPKPNRGKKGFTDEERAGFQNFVDAGFVDTFRMFTQGNGHYSWWSHFANSRARNVGWRIDYVLVSAAAARRGEERAKSMPPSWAAIIARSALRSMRESAAAHWRGRSLSAVLFDLDGTLLDTVADIASALNRTLLEHGCDPLAASDVRRMIGRGSPILIERAAASQGHTFGDAAQAAMVERFFHHCGELEESNEDRTQPYAGAAESLRSVHEAGLRTAVVTNKQHRFAAALLKRLGLAGWVDVVIGGDTCPRRKPDPLPLLFACESLHVPPSESLMVGDSVNDVQAARAAGIPVVCVSYGYNEGRDPRTLDCDTLLDSLAELPALLQLRGPPARPHRVETVVSGNCVRKIMILAIAVSCASPVFAAEPPSRFWRGCAAARASRGSDGGSQDSALGPARANRCVGIRCGQDRPTGGSHAQRGSLVSGAAGIRRDTGGVHGRSTLGAARAPGAFLHSRHRGARCTGVGNRTSVDHRLAWL